MKVIEKIPHRQRFFLVLLVIVWGMGLIFLGRLFVGQIWGMRAQQAELFGDHGAAEAGYAKAIARSLDPGPVWQRLGEMQFQRSGHATAAEAWRLGMLAREAFETARQQNPRDAEAVFGVARSTAQLARLAAYDKRVADDRLLDATPYFEKTLELRPNGIAYQMAYARYLAWQGRSQRLIDLIQALVANYPPAYHDLPKQSFWRASYRQSALTGLNRAFEAGHLPRETRFALAEYYRHNRDYEKALAHYRDAVQRQAYSNEPEHLFVLASLLLENHQWEAAGNQFYGALAAMPDKSRAFYRVYLEYARLERVDLFVALYDRMPPPLRIHFTDPSLLVRSLMRLKRYPAAQQILTQQVQQSPSAPSYALLAEIGLARKRYPEGLADIEKALELDSRSGRAADYFRIKAILLSHMGRPDALAAVDLAIAQADPVTHGLYDLRASIRWGQGDVAGAVADWTQAARRNPKRAYYFERLAKGYARLGNPAKVRHYYERALALDPANARYQKALSALTAKDIAGQVKAP